MPTISVITPTVRPEGLALVEKALRRQTFRDFEWIVTTPDSTVPLLNILKGVTVLEDPDELPGDYWSLNKAMNEAIRQSKGDLIVSWQDWTYAKPDCLEKFAFHFKEEPKTLVTAVGNKYQDETWTVQTWKDPRERDDQGSYYQCYPSDIEANLCSVPKSAFYAVGGYDESLDKFAGMDAYSVFDRLGMVGGWDFKIDQTNKSFSLEHGRLANWDERNAIKEEYRKKQMSYLENPVLSYLQ